MRAGRCHAKYKYACANSECCRSHRQDRAAQGERRKIGRGRGAINWPLVFVDAAWERVVQPVTQVLGSVLIVCWPPKVSLHMDASCRVLNSRGVLGNRTVWLERFSLCLMCVGCRDM